MAFHTTAILAGCFLSCFLNIHIIFDIPGYYFGNLGNSLRGRKGESCCHPDILTPCLFSGRRRTTFHQAGQICCVWSFNVTNLSGKFYLTSYFLGSWWIWGHIRGMVGWCHCSGPSSPLCCSGFRPRGGAMHRWLGWRFSLKRRKSLSICTVGQLQEFSWSLQIFISTSEMHWWLFGS